jgi:hypothetical protein
MAHACNLALERLRQEDHEFQDSLGYIITLSHKKKKKKRKEKGEGGAAVLFYSPIIQIELHSKYTHFSAHLTLF